ncbi:MAG: zinc-dependent peptidase, partial [Planctomycetes bacterium]|nr:zinc-dependent peptidase [Planctomycetota bacterium]
MFLFKRLRRKRIAGRAFPASWLGIIEANVSIYRKLTRADKEELQRHILIFLAEKHFVGCGGLEITDEIRVTIAAQ